MKDKDRNPFFSIIIPVFNTADYLDRCLLSVINDNNKTPYEIIIVDDGSTDDSAEKCDYYRKQDHHISVIHKTNGGQSSARNLGIKQARGQYVYFLDSDDFLFAGCLERIYEYLSIQTGCDILQVSVSIKRERKKVDFLYKPFNTEMPYNGHEFLKKSLHSSFCTAPWGYFFRRAFLCDNNLFFHEGIFHEDEEFTPLALLVANEVLTFDCNVYCYCIRKGSTTTQKNKTKNANDLLIVCSILEPVFLNVTDNELRALLLDRLVSICFSAFFVGYKTDKQFGKKIDSKVLDYSYSLKNKLKTCLFKLNPGLFFTVLNLIHIVKR